MLNKIEIINARYQIIKKLGAGEKSKIYLCQDLAFNNQSVVLKTISQEHEAYFKNELQLLSKFYHPNLPLVFDTGLIFDSKDFYYTREFAEGENFQTAFKNSPEKNIKIFIIQFLALLDFLHSNNIFHRDIKPENIIFNNDHFKLIDFGLAVKNKKKIKAQGTPLFLDPLSFDSNPNLAQTDLYAFGITILSIFPIYQEFVSSLEKNYTGSNSLLKVIEKFLPHINNSKIPTDLANLINRLIHPQKSNRLISAKEAISLMDNQISETEISLPKGVFIEREINSLSVLDQIDKSDKGQVFIIHGHLGTGKSMLLQDIKIKAQLRNTAILTIIPQEHKNLPFKIIEDLKNNFSYEEKLLSDKFAYFYAVKNYLENLAKQQSCIILIDDFENFNSFQKECLEFIARSFLIEQSSNTPNILFSSKSNEVFSSLISLQSPNLSTFETKPFSKKECSCFLQSILHNHNQKQIDQIYNFTGGNLLYIQELLNHLKINNQLALTNQGWKITNAKFDIPENLNAILKNKLKNLKQDHINLINYFSLLIEPKTKNFIKNLLSESSQNTENNINDLESIDLITKDQKAGAYSITNQLYCEIIKNEIPAKDIQVLYKKIASALENNPQDINQYELAHYLLKANQKKQAAKLPLIQMLTFLISKMLKSI